jgi:uncharacterized protein (DUF362 family)
MMTSVAIVKGNQPSIMVDEALKLIEADKLITPKDEVLIKPNYVSAKHPSTGITTDSRIVEEIIRFVKNSGVMNVIVGEGGAGDTERAFDVTEIRGVTRRQGARLVNLNQDSRVQVRIPRASALHEVGTAETALKSSCIINVPKLKVHHMALATISMKNLMGLILPKNIMHSQIDEKIVDLASFFKDKVKINIVDGIIGAEIDETSGSPVEMDLVIAGQDMVAVDSVASTVMGIDPLKVKYLRLAEERGLGVSNLSEIEVLGKPIEEVARKFRLPSGFK